MAWVVLALLLSQQRGVRKLAWVVLALLLSQQRGVRKMAWVVIALLLSQHRGGNPDSVNQCRLTNGCNSADHRSRTVTSLLGLARRAIRTHAIPRSCFRGYRSHRHPLEKWFGWQHAMRSPVVKSGPWPHAETGRSGTSRQCVCFLPAGATQTQKVLV